MDSDRKEKLKQYVENWKRVGMLLEEIEKKELRAINIADEVLSLSDASEAALNMYPPKPTSGLIEMQKLFMKLRK